VVGTGVAAMQLGSEFVPRLSEGMLVINTVRLAAVFGAGRPAQASEPRAKTADQPPATTP
jgi:Cu/Ag efflux pump CusA